MAASIPLLQTLATTFTPHHCHYQNFHASRQVIDFIEVTTKKPAAEGVWCRTRGDVMALWMALQPVQMALQQVVADAAAAAEPRKENPPETEV
jgi:hypothetical protein